jgi:hypothetical protein
MRSAASWSSRRVQGDRLTCPQPIGMRGVERLLDVLGDVSADLGRLCIGLDGSPPPPRLMGRPSWERLQRQSLLVTASSQAPPHRHEELGDRNRLRRHRPCRAPGRRGRDRGLGPPALDHREHRPLDQRRHLRRGLQPDPQRRTPAVMTALRDLARRRPPPRRMGQHRQRQTRPHPARNRLTLHGIP